MGQKKGGSGAVRSKHFSKGRPGALNSDMYYMSGVGNL